jgi:hypothetical protein
MKWDRFAAYAILATLALCGVGHSLAQSCWDIRSIDLPNSTIQTVDADNDANRITHKFPNPLNDPAGVRTIRLRRGGYLFQDNRTEWNATLLQSRLVQPSPEVFVRIVEVSVGNMGDGAFGYILALGCRDGKLVTLFQHSGFGVGGVHVRAGAVVVDQRIWRKDEGVCCASLEGKFVYTWNPALNSYTAAEEPKITRAAP